MMTNVLGNMLKRIRTHQQTLVICLLLAVGSLVTRFMFAAQVISFHQDMARDTVLMESALERGEWLVQYGPKASVWNFFLPPFYFQLHLLLTALSNRDPLIMIWTVTFVEALTPVVLFLLLRSITSWRKALLAATIYLFSATVVSLGTRAWNPNMIPFTTAVLLLGSVQLLVEKKRWGVYLAAAAFLIGFQLHYQVTLLAPFFTGVVLYAWYKKLLSWRDIVLLVLLALGSLSTYFYAEITNGWHNTKEILQYFSLEHSRYYDQVSKPAFVLNFLPGFIERVLFGVHTNYVIGRVILFGGLFTLLVQSRKSPAARVLLAFLLSVFLMLRVYKGDKTDYYLSTLFLMPAVLLASMLQAYRYLGYAVVLVVVATLPRWMSVVQPSNDFILLQENMFTLSELVPGSAVQFLFQSDDDINVYAYGLRHFGDLQIDPSSQTLVEVCKDRENCVWQGEIACTKSRSYTYSALLKAQHPHDQFVLETENKFFSITQFYTPIVKAAYPLYAVDLSYGTDILLPEAYNW